LIQGFGTEAKQALRQIAKDSYYTHVFDALIDAVAEGI